MKDRPCEEMVQRHHCKTRMEAPGESRTVDTFLLTAKMNLAHETWLWLVYQVHTAPWEENLAILRFSTCKHPLKTHGYCRGNV